MKIQYENKYGTLELEPLEYRHVSTVLHATTPDDLKFDFETAEKIALDNGEPPYSTGVRHEALSGAGSCITCRPIPWRFAGTFP